MNTFAKCNCWVVIVVMALLSLNVAHAHLMVAQHGTLNWKGDSLFVVLSLPVSAFENVDDDMDGSLSAGEFNRHRPALTATVSEGVILRYKSTVLRIEGLLLSLDTEHHDGKEFANQLVVTGKYSMLDVGEKIRLHINLYGGSKAEQFFKIALSRPEKQEKKTLLLTMDEPSAALFSQ